jgi:hypothetical protein
MQGPAKRARSEQQPYKQQQDQQQQQEQQERPHVSSHDEPVVAELHNFMVDQLAGCRDSEDPALDGFVAKLAEFLATHAARLQQQSSCASCDLISIHSSKDAWLGAELMSRLYGKALPSTLVGSVDAGAALAIKELHCSSSTTQRCRLVVQAVLLAAADAVQQQQSLTAGLCDMLTLLTKLAAAFGIAHMGLAEKAGFSDTCREQFVVGSNTAALDLYMGILRIVYPCLFNSEEGARLSSSGGSLARAFQTVFVQNAASSSSSSDGSDAAATTEWFTSVAGHRSSSSTTSRNRRRTKSTAALKQGSSSSSSVAAAKDAAGDAATATGTAVRSSYWSPASAVAKHMVGPCRSQEVHERQLIATDLHYSGVVHHSSSSLSTC